MNGKALRIDEIPRRVWQGARHAARSALLPGLVAWTIVVIVAWALAAAGIDRSWVQAIGANRDPVLVAVAQTLSRIGEMHLAPLFTLALIAASARLADREAWWVAAWAGFLGMITAGISALLLKMLIGRPRPKLQVEDVVHGFSWHWSYHSFPSGHTAHWFGLVAALAVIAPRWSVGVGIFAGAVAWSRVYLGQHYVGDILGGITLGVTVGLVFGLGARRLLRKGAPLKATGQAAQSTAIEADRAP